jgi:hypothetical protein
MISTSWAMPFGAEVEHLLGLADATDHGAGEGAAVSEQGVRVQRLRLGRGTGADHRPVEGESRPR